MRRRIGALAVATVLGAALLGALADAGSQPAEAQESGWSVTEFAATYRIREDGVVDVEERVTVDFGKLLRHGIYRDLFETAKCGPPPSGGETRRFVCPEGWVRKWSYRDFSVVDERGAAWKSERESLPGTVRLRIGDPDEWVSGVQTYVIRYGVERALDSYSDHDELYWNVTGRWQVPVERFELRVELARGDVGRVACFVGEPGSTEPCMGEARDGVATFRSRPLAWGEQVTVAVGWEAGLVRVMPPKVIEPAGIDDYVKLDAVEVAGLVLSGVIGVAGALALWWRHGRDRRYRSIYYLTQDVEEETRPLFGGPPLVVEYLPPEDLRPAQMGVLLDERADVRDVTATIVDLAVRGYLHITEIPKQGLLGRVDWELTKLKPGDDLLPYEAALLDALFEGGERVKVSELKYKFADDLRRVQGLLYDDAMARGWFAVRPGSAKGSGVVAALGVLAGAVGLSLASATLLGRGLLPAGLAAGGLAQLGLAPAMARRTAMGSEMLRRVLGFRLYIETAEKHRQEFNEQQNIFARYLPFAIVFGCVEKWAKAFSGLDAAAREATTAWYTGVGPFQVMAFSEGLRTFDRSVGATLGATRSSGGSGFSGGSGGGGGGGGGGSW